jgi:hypothetical protein
VGFAIDVEATAGALETTGAPAPAPADDNGRGAVLVAGPPGAALPIAEKLRGQGRRAAVVHDGLRGAELDAYARRWHFTEVVRAGARGPTRGLWPSVARPARGRVKRNNRKKK